VPCCRVPCACSGAVFRVNSGVAVCRLHAAVPFAVCMQGVPCAVCMQGLPCSMCIQGLPCAVCMQGVPCACRGAVCCVHAGAVYFGDATFTAVKCCVALHSAAPARIALHCPPPRPPPPASCPRNWAIFEGASSRSSAPTQYSRKPKRPTKELGGRATGPVRSPGLFGRLGLQYYSDRQSSKMQSSARVSILL
jgi:hypothetical protein